LLLASIITVGELFAAEPSTLQLPWATFGVDPSRRGPMLAALQRSWSASPTSATGPNPTAIQPVWCNYFDKDLFFVVSTERDSGRLLSVATHSQTKRKLNAAIVRKQATAEATSIVQAMRALPQVLAELPTLGTGLRIGLTSGVTPTRQDESTSVCLELLLAQTLLPTVPIVSPVGLAAHVRAGFANTPLRPTRAINLRWQVTRSPKITVNALATYVEAVLGNHIPPLKFTPVQFGDGADSTTPTFSLPKEIQDMLNSESLAHSELPQVCKTYGAWAYVDRGRAWGLPMRTRLISADGKVAGHVVGYYGPHAAMQCPRGKSVAEGAIVFIRKGQNDVTTGLTLNFDPKEYPSPQ
jgi:hypothetical protein